MDIPSLPPLRGNFVLLRAGALVLLLPQQEVGAAAYLDPRPVPGPEPGLLHLPGDADDAPFAALSPRMTLLPECPPDRFIGAPLAGNDHITWCWQELRVLIGALLFPQRLPAVLRSRASPLHSFVVIDGHPVFPCGGEAVCHHALAIGVEHAT